MKGVNLLFIILGFSGLTACANLDGPADGLATGPIAHSPFMPEGAQVEGPRGYVDMCRDRPRLCADERIVARNAAPTPPASNSDAGETSTGAITPQVQSAVYESADRPTLIRSTDSTPPTVTTAVAYSRGAEDHMPPAIGRLPFSDRLKMLERVDRYVNGNVRQATDMEVYGVEEYWNRSGVGPGARGDCEDLAIEKRMELIDQGFPPEDLFYAVAYRRDIGLHAVLVAHTEMGDLVLDSLSTYITVWNRAPYTWVKRQSQANSMVWNMVDEVDRARPVLRVASQDRAAPAEPGGGGR